MQNAMALVFSRAHLERGSLPMFIGIFMKHGWWRCGCCLFVLTRPGNVHEFDSETTSCERIADIFEAKHNRLEFLLVYYTGHTSKDEQLEKCLEKVSVQRLLCIIDCCRADEVRLIDKKECSRVVLRSSEGTAKASPTSGSTFTRYYLAGLRSAKKCPCPHGVGCRHLRQFRENSLASGFVTLANLFTYAADHMNSQKPRREVISYLNNNNELLAFFNQEPIVYSLQLVWGNEHLPGIEIEEQKIDFNGSIDDIREQLRQEIALSLCGQGLYVYVLLTFAELTCLTNFCL